MVNAVIAIYGHRDKGTWPCITIAHHHHVGVFRHAPIERGGGGGLVVAIKAVADKSYQSIANLVATADVAPHENQAIITLSFFISYSIELILSIAA